MTLILTQFSSKVINLQELTEELLQKDNYFLYIHTPFCGTCHLARTMLEQVEQKMEREIFYEMNASLYPNFMQEQQIESVPCLLIKVDGKIEEKIYAFRSVPFLLYHIDKYTERLV